MSEAFEDIIGVLLEADGYWIKRNVKLQVPGAAALGLKSGACELDLVAFRPTDPAEVLIIECKSFGRSGGIDWKTFAPPEGATTRRHRYKLFWSQQLRQGIVELLQVNRITPPQLPHVFCLASAATAKAHHQLIANHLSDSGMRFFDRFWVEQRLQALGNNRVYQNCVVSSLACFYHSTANNGYA